MTTAAPIASHGTSAHLPAGLVVLHPARTASASTVSASTVQGRSRVPASSQSVRSSRAAHAPRPAQEAQPAHAPAVSTPVVSTQASSAAQAPSAKSVLLAKGGELLRSVPGSIRRLGTVRGFLKGLPLLTLAALIVLGAISFFGPAASASVENASVTRTVIVVKHGETLWDIAQAVNPQGDTRDTVVRIMELNSLTSTSVDAGQRLEIPQTQR
ncbi:MULTISPECIES: LysM peptidoglycan-binding domain-containing protein [unclassified Rothia (in: high G+C Gram-positive bacteria)]|jgi:peptidoglycan-binding lysM|uniref:LysM peptidoglycan-binding domain-containing protein n=1 Tax=unclassified Rothia (in: high G+C Gram-positive bacteria) TaxID=2689056 RepID=UPI0008CFE65A|nr:MULTISPECIES: LysM peptidoglycan-binding domain-containing protein [unclassified Rothia (in: high G+C Gram-positive bacteria)]OFJ97469.1 peptidoglycan-binding protein [Rothia sp. HMSC065C12]OFR26613.1 peptidoglycan-binding protein [Rothia sp. HMSC066G02]OFR45960.1 peptidoglycan-binding protein [Rothia sp. HMSC073B08]